MGTIELEVGVTLVVELREVGDIMEGRGESTVGHNILWGGWAESLAHTEGGQCRGKLLN